MRHSHVRSGFTLVELLVVVAIVGALAVIAVSSYRGYLVKARRTEVKVTLGTILRMMTAAQSDPHALPVVLGEPLTTTDTSTDSSCVTQNTLNFAPESCVPMRYAYYRLSQGVAAAIELRQLPCPSHKGRVSQVDCIPTRDIWIISNERGLEHLTDSYQDCGGVAIGARLTTVWGAAGGGSSFDVNLDGVVDAADFGAIAALPIWDPSSCP